MGNCLHNLWQYLIRVANLGGSRPQQGGKSYAEGVKNNISTYIRKNLRNPKPVSTLFIKDAGLGCISVVFVVHIAL